jgi:hypothetical protein
MAEQSAEGGLALRARLITVPFNDLPAILRGQKRLANLPETGYIRALQLNLRGEALELMVIDAAYAPVANLGDMKTEPAILADVQLVTMYKPTKKRKR